MVALDVVKDTKNFKALREEWNELALQTGTIFQSWEWSWRWWQANSRGKQLAIVTARDDNKLVGLAPLCIASSYCGLPLKVASFIGTNGTDYLGFLARARSTAIVEKLLDFSLEKVTWDALDLHQLSDGDPLLSVVSDKLMTSNFAFDKIEQDFCYRVELPKSFEELLSQLGKKLRWNVQYYRRRLVRDHDVVFRLSGCDTVERDIGTFFDLHKKRFLDMKKPGAYLSPSYRRMHAGIALELCETGWLRLYIMEIDARPVAAFYGFSFADSLYYYLGGFDPAWGKMSVSTVLIAHVIEQATSEGFAHFDFLRGQEPYKQKWMATESCNYRVLVRRPGAKSHLTKKILSLENELARKAKDMVLNMR